MPFTVETVYNYYVESVII